MSKDTHESAVGTYILIALVLGVITYVEFAIVEYEVAWLSDLWTLIWLAVLSVIKFILVVAFFMHLKDDEFAYTGFFSSGMIIALGTFIVLTAALFTGRSFASVRAETAPAVEAHADEGGHDDGAGEAAAEHGEAAGGHGGVPAHLHDSIVTEGYSRPLGERFDAPPPKNQGFALALPLAEYDGRFTVRSASTPVRGGGTAEPRAQADGGSAAGEGDAPADGFDRALGEETYAGNCVGCHQADGAGLAGVFPPLAGHLPRLLAAEGGREHLVRVLLYGLQGPIEAEGSSYNGQMPPYPHFSDAQIAAVLNHELTAWGNETQLEDFRPITADEVAALRGQGLAPTDVLEQRPALP